MKAAGLLLALAGALAGALSPGAWAADKAAPVLREGQASEAALLEALDPPRLRQWAPGQRPAVAPTQPS